MTATIGKQRFGAPQRSTLMRPSKIDRKRQRNEDRLFMEVAATQAALNQLGRF